MKKQEGGEMCAQACVHVSVCECLETSLLSSGNNKDSPPQRHNIQNRLVCVCICALLCV